MRDVSIPADEPVILDAVLRPSPPLSRRASVSILVAVAAANLAVASYFAFRGAWPVSPFMGADVLLLAWAFRAIRRAAQREEQITLTPSVLRVARRFGCASEKRESEFTFNPYWVRVMVDRPQTGAPSDDPFGKAIADHALQLTLWSHGRFLRIGSFLAPAERAAFASRLEVALRALKTQEVSASTSVMA